MSEPKTAKPGRAGDKVELLPGSSHSMTRWERTQGVCFNVPGALLSALDHQFHEDLYDWNPAEAEQSVLIKAVLFFIYFIYFLQACEF